MRWDKGDRRSKLGGAQRSWLTLMAQLQAHVPDPLTDDLPGFLSSGCMTAPAIRVLFVIFIGKGRFKSATMQVECHDIGGGEPILREMGEKEFVDHAFAGATDAALFLGRQVGSHHDAAAAARLPHRDIGAVVERAHQGAFRATEVGIGGQVEPRLHGRVIQHRVVFASHHEEEAVQICNDGPSAVEAVQSQQGTCLRQTERLEIATDDHQRECQFLPVLPVASVSETTELCGIDARYPEKRQRNRASIPHNRR